LFLGPFLVFLFPSTVSLLLFRAPFTRAKGHRQKRLRETHQEKKKKKNKKRKKRKKKQKAKSKKQKGKKKKKRNGDCEV
jgi:hypothetical protein